MALIWADGFDHYGTSPNGGRDAMLAGAWAAFSWANGTAHEVSAAQARTGTHSLRHSYNSLATGGIQARRVLGAAQIVVGCAAGWYFNSLPGVNAVHGFEFRNNANNAIATITIQSDGALGLYVGASRTFLAASDPIISASSWQHIEAKIVCDTVVGECEIRVNGVTVLHVTDQNLGSLGCTQIVFGIPGSRSGGNLTYYTDDIVVWNDVGDDNNDFIGQCRVETIFPVADTAQADWTLVGDSDGFDCIDNVPPDGDTTYIQGANVGDISQFELDDLPPETAKIIGVYIPVMAKIDDAGVGAVKTGLLSGSDLALSGELTLTTAYTYWGAVFERDPATDEPWTKTGLEAALLHIEKSA